MNKILKSQRILFQKRKRNQKKTLRVNEPSGLSPITDFVKLRYLIHYLKKCFLVTGRMRFHVITSETNNEDNKDLRLTITLMFITLLFIVTTTPTRAYHIGKSNFMKAVLVNKQWQ